MKENAHLILDVNIIIVFMINQNKIIVQLKSGGKNGNCISNYHVKAMEIAKGEKDALITVALINHHVMLVDQVKKCEIPDKIFDSIKYI